MKLQLKFFLSYMFFISIFSVFFMISFFLFFSKQKEKDIYNSAERAYSVSSAFLNYQLRQCIYTSQIVNSSKEVSDAKLRLKEERDASPGIQILDATQINDVINRSIISLNNVNMTMYVDNSFGSVLNQKTMKNLDTLEQYSWLTDFQCDKKQTTWQITSHNTHYSSSNVPCLSLFRKVHDSVSPTWISEIYIDMENIREILSSADPTGKGIVFLQDKDDVILSCTDEETTLQFLDKSSAFFHKGQMDWITASLNGKKYLIYSHSLTSTGWYMTLLVPLNISFFPMEDIFQYALFIIAGLIIISLIAARFFTHIFSYRLLLLDSKLSELRDGNLDAYIEVHGKDEIARLFHSFNYMTLEIKRLVQQQYQNGILVKTAELKALQAQINPHFLYNTLELVSWKAMEKDADEIVEIVQNLSNFYRLTLGKGFTAVPLQNELKHISHYLNIQNLRFDQEIQILLDIPDECISCLIPRLTLQPLIENSVLHGFIPRQENDNRENIIWIKAVKTNDSLLITLQDNGIGMSPEKCQKILSPDNPAKKDSFGVMNIHQRIQLLCGEEYGLTYSTDLNGGVCVVIKLKCEL